MKLCCCNMERYRVHILGTKVTNYTYTIELYYINFQTELLSIHHQPKCFKAKQKTWWHLSDKAAPKYHLLHKSVFISFNLQVHFPPRNKTKYENLKIQNKNDAATTRSPFSFDTGLSLGKSVIHIIKYKFQFPTQISFDNKKIKIQNFTTYSKTKPMIALY